MLTYCVFRLKNADLQQTLKEEAAKAESLLEQEADAVRPNIS